MDLKSKLIDKYIVTAASVHDSQAMEALVEEKDKVMYADSAYCGEPIAKILRNKGIENRIHEKGYRGHPLTDEQKERNLQKSKLRVCVEHVFGFMTGALLHGTDVRSISL